MTKQIEGSQTQITAVAMQLVKTLVRIFTRYFPLTLQGSATAVIGVAALGIYGYGNLDLVVFALAVCALAILTSSFLLSLATGLLLQRRLTQANTAAANLIHTSTHSKYLESQYPNETGFSLPAYSHLPLVTLKWEILAPNHLNSRLNVNRLQPTSEWNEKSTSTLHSSDGVAAADQPRIGGTILIEEVTPGKRCHSTTIERLFCVEDVLGLCRYRWLHREQQALTVLPQSKSLSSLPLLRSLTAEDGVSDPYGEPHGDRMEIRPYVPGDSVRNILWKSYARNRQLNVRLAEKSVHHSNRTLAYLVTGAEDEAAAAVARVAVESGALGDDWAFGTDAPASNRNICNSVDTISDALLAIAASRPLPSSGRPFWHRDEVVPNPYGLDDFLQQEQQTHHGISHCIVFASADADQDSWPERLSATISSYSGHVSLVLATDGFVKVAERSLWHKLLYSKPDPASNYIGTAGGDDGSHSQIQELLTRFGQRVESLMIVDRNTGFCFDQRLNRLG